MLNRVVGVFKHLYIVVLLDDSLGVAVEFGLRTGAKEVELTVFGLFGGTALRGTLVSHYLF
jgi:hypothetical protein